MLTNNESSPLIETTGKNLFETKTINFDPNRPVKYIQARDDGNSCIARITFLDKEGVEIDCYNPKLWKKEGEIRIVGEKEELIGVYGVRNKAGNDWFSSFGFIVRVRSVSEQK